MKTVILIALFILSTCAFLFCSMMILRIEWLKLNFVVLIDADQEVAERNLPRFEQMLNRWWIWNFKKLLK